MQKNAKTFYVFDQKAKVFEEIKFCNRAHDIGLKKQENNKNVSTTDLKEELAQSLG